MLRPIDLALPAAARLTPRQFENVLRQLADHYQWTAAERELCREIYQSDRKAHQELAKWI